MFIDVVVINGEEKNQEGNNGKSHNSEPEEVLSFISGGIDPGDVPEVITGDGHDGTGEEGEETPVGEGEVAVSVELADETAAGVVQAIGTNIGRNFPFGDLEAGSAGGGKVFSRAASVEDVGFIDIEQFGVAGVGFGGRLVVGVDSSRVTVAVAGKVDQEDEGD